MIEITTLNGTGLFLFAIVYLLIGLIITVVARAKSTYVTTVPEMIFSTFLGPIVLILIGLKKFFFK